MVFVVAALLFAVVVISVLVLSAEAEARCALPDEPWLEWDGATPAELTHASPKRRIHDVRNGWEPNHEALRAAKGEDA